jgi:hypothetical protein
MGLGPVLVLSVAVVISALIGLGLSHHTSTPKIADELGCEHISSGTSSTGVSQETCTYHGDRIIIWSLSRGSNKVYPVRWVDNGLVGPKWDWVIGCADRDDCVAIHDQLGGQLLGRDWLGISVDVH